MKLLSKNVSNGRIVMLTFMLFGLLLVFYGNQDLFSAVAVSGTASLFLAPVVFFSIFANRTDIPVWSFFISFLIAIFGACLYFSESSGYTALMGDLHKYTKLLQISVVVLVMCNILFYVGSRIKQLNYK